MFPSATDECIRCYRLRYLLSIVGGYVFVGAVIIYPTILPPCFSGGNFSLRLTLSRGQPRAILARRAERKQKRPVLTHTDHGKHQKANGARSLKNVPRLCISTSLKARFDKRMQPHSMPVLWLMATDFLWNRLLIIGRWAERSVLFSKRHEVRSPPQVFTQNISYSIVYVSTLMAILIIGKYSISKFGTILYHKRAKLSICFVNIFQIFLKK